MTYSEGSKVLLQDPAPSRRWYVSPKGLEFQAPCFHLTFPFTHYSWWWGVVDTPPWSKV
ncbi:hypothetical protein BofuT4_uP043840.1 [Botrytis cinerea T4]|uniref:Uncharacterized protein n=1 Tax=Botryotinia fuckeliana (strain T4) TaxID=999810 RepID=G2Y043_BOTF4|nr:hypothetical protein BofuT4_uP043840.1 [Botrytis cinerea T4]